MRLETENRKAFELLASALSSIDNYKQTRDRQMLSDAGDKLEQALTEDKLYVRALYNSAIVKDLCGESREAVKRLEQILEMTRSRTLNPQAREFVEQTQYQLALAYCHNYDRESLEKAVVQFQELIEKTESPILRLLSHLGLAQVYSMRIVKPAPGMSEADSARQYFELFDRQIKVVKTEFSQARRAVDDATLRSIQWAMSNSQALALMYYTDFMGMASEKLAQLNEALKFLHLANESDPMDWANYVDQGSAHMRLGYWLTKQGDVTAGQKHFKEALKCFEQVKSSLRPNYGFMFYEMGRTYRLMGDFKNAKEHLQEAMTIDRNLRDISDESIAREIQRADAHSTDFP